MKPIDCAEIARVPEAGTDRTWLDMTGADGARIRAGLSPAHVSTLNRRSAAFWARHPAPKPAAPAKPVETA